LAASLGALVDVLQDPSVNANYRIAFTTSDNGNVGCDGTTPEGGMMRMSSCSTRVDEFTNLQGTEDRYEEACGAVCDAAPGEGFTTLDLRPTVTGTDPVARVRPWLERTEGKSNLPADLGMAEALACAAPQGLDGCGYESPLESMYKALARAETPGQEQFGFRREDAVLALLVVTDEADCSMNRDWDEEVLSPLLPEGSCLFWENPVGNPTSSVCWNAGVACTGDPAAYTSCEPANRGVGAPNQLPVANDPLSNGVWPTDIIDDPTQPEVNAVLFPVAKYVDDVQDQEDRSKVFDSSREVIVGLIAGVPLDYTTNPDVQIPYADAVDADAQDNFGVGFGCTSEGLQAVPPVRLRHFAEAFVTEPGRNVHSICADDYAFALESVGKAIAAQLGPACYPLCVQDVDPSTAKLDPDCRVFQSEPGTMRREVPACDGSTLPEGEVVCYVTITDSEPSFSPRCAEQAYNLEFALVRDPDHPVPVGTAVEAECLLSETPTEDCPGFQG
jgi:hypothetical protein